MKVFHIIFCCSLLTVSVSFGQKTQAELIFKDGTVLKGFGEPTTVNNIRFRKERKAKKEFYSFEEVDTLKVYYDFDPTVFVMVKVQDKTSPKVLELAHTGKNVVYYREILNGYMPSIAHAPSGGGGLMMPSVGGFYNLTNSYVRKTGEEEAVHLGSSDWITKNFKKAASNFFSDCQELVDQIQEGQLKKRDLKAIIWFYNSECK